MKERAGRDPAVYAALEFHRSDAWRKSLCERILLSESTSWTLDRRLGLGDFFFAKQEGADVRIAQAVLDSINARDLA